MKRFTRSLTLTATTLAALLGFAPKSEARVIVRVAAPRVYAPVRVATVRPGPAYVLVEGAWVLPPFAGAVWVPGHWSGGYFIRGHWRA